jgi:tetratricopeptide (TPR) repeat protein
MVLEATGDPAVMAEVAGHWAAAGRPADELRASVAAAEAALQVFAFGQAADLWRRAIELSQRQRLPRSGAKRRRPRLSRSGAGGRRCGRATDVTITVLANLARLYIVNGRLDEALASLQRGNDLVHSLESLNADAGSGGLLAAIESDLLLKTGRPQQARDVGIEGHERAKRIGQGESVFAVFPLANAVEATLEMGDTAEAARLLDPLTTDETST